MRGLISIDAHRSLAPLQRRSKYPAHLVIGQVAHKFRKVTHLVQLGHDDVNGESGAQEAAEFSKLRLRRALKASHGEASPLRNTLAATQTTAARGGAPEPKAER
jgi:hypothetical protein